MMKAALFGLVVCLLSLNMKTIRNEYSFLIILIGGIVLSGLLIREIKTVMDVLLEIQSKSGVSSEFMKILFKLIGISFLGDFVSNICLDAGQKTIAKQVEMLSKLSILVVSLPILESLIHMIEKLMES
ncbi:MAG: SpoIIIAC/SpoIIIAD family protein [Anaerostipes sp.]|jgi:stage III sporulation protein AD|nr:SpoIIIAC/SpoIIIAD family protein [Anaerostipes sp.]MDD3747013.1 SpoIIIAC/SpoIIIAD family protein [Anaerostipes sp.]